MKTNQVFNKLALIVGVMICTGLSAQEQTGTSTIQVKPKIDRWSVSVYAGPSQFYGDIAGDVFWPGGRRNGEIGLNFQGFATRQFTPVYGLNFKVMYTDVVSEESLKKIYFNSSVFHYGFNNTISFSNWFWPNRTKKRWDGYFLAGLGLNHYRTLTRNSLNDSIISYFGYTNGGLDKTDRLIKTTYNLGFGMKYRLSSRLDIGVEVAQLNLPVDNLDGIVVVLSELDKYGYTSIGLTYKFGKGGNNLLWESKSPLADDPAMKKTNDKLDSLGNVINNMNINLTMLMKEREMEKGPDLDEDGVPDYRDLELNTPRGNMVNFLGVTIPNCCDPSKPNYKAASGAAAAGAIASSGNLISSVFFPLNSTYVTPINRERIAIAALMLKRNPSWKLDIVGSACLLASDDYNIDLSMRRANTIKNILVKEYGISESRLLVKYDGESKPLNSSQENKHLNRRVDLLFNN